MKKPKTLPIKSAAPIGIGFGDRLDGDEILEALKECEYALKQAIRTGKIGWLQQVALQTACDALNKRLAAIKAKPSNVGAEPPATKKT